MNFNQNLLNRFRKAKGINCDGQDNSAATHSNSELISEITLPWTTPLFTSGPDKIVEFKFTVVKDYSTYWVKEYGMKPIIIEKYDG